MRLFLSSPQRHISWAVPSASYPDAQSNVSAGRRDLLRLFSSPFQMSSLKVQTHKTHVHTCTQRGSILHFNCASLPRELFISGDFIVLFHSYWCKADFQCVCWRDVEGNRLLLVLIPVWLCCWDRDPGSGGVRPQAELLCVCVCVSWCGMCCVTALIRCCFFFSEVTLRLWDHNFLQHVFLIFLLYHGSSDAICFLSFIRVVLVTVFVPEALQLDKWVSITALS